ncbi:MAG: zinc ribbon domain-containing protein [Oscillibacter sp.]|nr:zinc ribbon domain-containing protein [Oscillibacter sp.]
MLLFLTLLQVGLSCLCALLFYGAALLWSRRGKSPWGLFLSGTLLQGFLEFGHVSGMVRRQETVTAEDAAQWVLFALLAVGTWYLLWRWEHPAAPKSDAAPAERPLVEWEPQTPGAHFCHRCGAALYPGAAFCGQCGAAVLTRNTAGHSEKDQEES